MHSSSKIITAWRNVRFQWLDLDPGEINAKQSFDKLCGRGSGTSIWLDKSIPFTLDVQFDFSNQRLSMTKQHHVHDDDKDYKMLKDYSVSYTGDLVSNEKDGITFTATSDPPNIGLSVTLDIFPAPITKCSSMIHCRLVPLPIILCLFLAVCLEQGLEQIWDPCGHLCACKQCADKLKRHNGDADRIRCPICQTVGSIKPAYIVWETSRC
jgi:hypothetical protein